MTVARALLTLGMMAAIGVAIVCLREEQAKSANRIQKLHQRQTELEQRLWTQDMELAALRSPDEIRRRASELGLDVAPPERDAVGKAPRFAPR